MSGPGPSKRVALASAVLSALLVTAACTDDAEGSAPDADPAGSNSTSPTDVESAVDVSQVRLELIEGAGEPALATADEAVEVPGYVEAEYLMSGVAGLYSGPPVGPAEVARTGIPYTTRVLVRVPENPAEFSGRVVVEPFNTSSGLDSDAAWLLVADRLVESGDAWIGVTERASSVGLLQAASAERYAALTLPYNGLAWDILAQVGGLLKEGGDQSPLADLDVEHLYMTGYSQSGIEAGTFMSAFHDRSRMTDGSGVFDGYLVMGRSGSLTPLDSGASALPAFEHLPLGEADVPVIEFQTETDVRGFSADGYTSPGGAPVRGTDSDTYRLYEVAGAAHTVISICDGPPTTLPTAPFAQAAYAALVAWAEDGEPAPAADPLSATSIADVTELDRDEHGNALGGVRSPFLDVPLATYESQDEPGVVCNLSGAETPFTREVAEDLYGDRDGYLEAFTESLDEATDAGFLLEADHDEILEGAEERADGVFGA